LHDLQRQTITVTRRSPHPLFGSAYELQTFECQICGGEIKRSSDGSGLPHASEAAPSGAEQANRFQKEFSISKFAIGEQVDSATCGHEGGTVVAVFPTIDGNFRYAVDMEGYGALQFFTEEKLVVHAC
jgi:hypothetical protein